MLTLAVTALLAEAANKASFITGGADGLQGMEMRPILGLFRFDLFGRTAYLYCLAVLFIAWVARDPGDKCDARIILARREIRPHCRSKLLHLRRAVTSKSHQPEFVDRLQPAALHASWNEKERAH